VEVCGYTYSFFRQLESGAITTTDVVRFFADRGLRQLEIADPYVAADEFATLTDLIRDSALTVACYDVVGDFGVQDVSETVHCIGSAFERAVALGAARVLLVPGSVDGDVTAEMVRRSYVEALRQCRADVERLGLTLMIANLGYQADICGTTEHVFEVKLGAGDYVRTTYDVGNYIMAGEDSLTALDRVWKTVEHVHLKDWRIAEPTSNCLAEGGYPALDGRCFYPVALGEGIVDLGGVLRRLHDGGYRGVLSIEYEGLGDPTVAIDSSLEFLRPLLRELERSA
jgi:3-dehydroshikimate dehydratase